MQILSVRYIADARIDDAIEDRDRAEGHATLRVSPARLIAWTSVLTLFKLLFVILSLYGCNAEPTPEAKQKIAGEK